MGIEQTNNFKIDLSVLKKGFQDYLEDKELLNGENEVTAGTTGSSIFLHSEEFKNYLVEEVGLDKSIFSQNINELMQGLVDGSLFQNQEVDGEVIDNLQNMEQEAEIEAQEGNGAPQEADGETAVEGEPIGDEGVQGSDDSFMLQALNEALSDAEVINSFDADGTGDLSQEEINKFLETVNIENLEELTFDELSKAIQELYAASEKQNIDKLMNQIFEDKDVIKVIDLDGDGVLTDEEKQKFQEFITGYTTGADELTYEDIQNAYNDILGGKFDYTSVKQEAGLEINEQDSYVNDSSVEELDTQAQTSIASGGGGTTSASYWGGSSDSNSNTPQVKTLDNMSLDDLKQERITRKQAVDDAQAEVDAINSGEKFKTEEENVKALEDAYKLALENDDKTPEGLLQCINDIDETEKNITDTKTEISTLNSREAEQQNVVNGIDTTIKSLEETQNQLSTMTSDDEEKQREITQKQGDIERKIGELRKEKEKEDKALQDIKDEKGEKEEALAGYESKLTELKANKEKLENDNKENLSQETQKAMDDYNKAKSAFDDMKAKEEKTAADNLKTALDQLKEVDDKINEKQAQETSSEFEVYDSSLPKEVASALDTKLGSGFSKRLEEICQKMQCEPKALVGLMFSESGLRPDAVNSSSGATGLIQFLPSTAKGYGTTTSALKGMNGVEQLDYVEKYLLSCKKTYFGEGEMSAGDLYSLVWLPAYAKRDVLTSQGQKYYSSGLDVNHDGKCTKDDLSQRIDNKYNEWLRSIGLA